MTDKEIIQRLECCSVRFACKDCQYQPTGEQQASCMDRLMKDALELINRQRAEIERLEKYNTDVAYKHYDDGIKEFAERLIAMLAKYDMYGTLYIVEDIDNLVKEMVGADNG